MTTFSWRSGIAVGAQPSLPTRALAFAVDLVLLFGVTWLIVFELEASGLVSVPTFVLGGRDLGEGLGLLWFLALLDLPVNLTYFTLAESLAGGRTLGKMLFGLRVVRADDGRAPRLLDAFLRNLLRLLWMNPLGPAFLAADGWLMATGELDQRIGDLAARTAVVSDR